MANPAEPISLPDGDRLLPIVPDVTDQLGDCARSTVYELFASGALASVKLGRRRMVRHSDLQAFIASLGE